MNTARIVTRARYGTGSNCCAPSGHAHSDLVAFEQGLCPRRDGARRNDAAAAIDDAVVPAVAAHDVVGAFEHFWKRLGLGSALAFFGMQKDRPGLGVGLQFREWPVSQDEIGFSSGHVLQAVAARHAVTVGYFPLWYQAICVRRAAPQGSDIFRGQAFELDGHREISGVVDRKLRRCASVSHPIPANLDQSIKASRPRTSPVISGTRLIASSVPAT